MPTLDRHALSVPGLAVVFQPGVDVGASVAGGAADPDERRSGALLAPAFQGPQADLQLVGELLLGEELVGQIAVWVVAVQALGDPSAQGVDAEGGA